MAKFDKVEKICEDLCQLSGDNLMRNKGIYLAVSNMVWEDMNEDVLKISSKVKIPTRWEFFVDKRTNTVLIPKNVQKLCSVSSVDRFGHYHPLYRNEDIPTDIVDIGASKNCACENECSYQLCNTIKGYEAVSSVKSDFLPDSTPISFTCIDRQMCDAQGFLYKQSQYPLRVYTSGIWTDTIKYTQDEKLCQLEVDNNGCVCDTESNWKSVCDASGINNSNCVVIGGTPSTPPCDDPLATTWIYHVGSIMEWYNTQCGCYPYGQNFNNIYNISVEGNRIILPHNFGFDKVMIRFYEDIDLGNLMIPYLAKNCFMTGLQYYSTMHNDKKLQLSQVYGQIFSREKWGLSLELNKNTIAENAAIYTPKVYIPSYIINRHNHNNR